MGYFHLLQPLPSRKPHITFRDCIQLGSLSSASQNFDIESDSSGFSLKPEEHEQLSSSLFLRQHGVRIPWVALVFRIRENTLISYRRGASLPLFSFCPYIWSFVSGYYPTWNQYSGNMPSPQGAFSLRSLHLDPQKLKSWSLCDNLRKIKINKTHFQSFTLFSLETLVFQTQGCSFCLVSG